ncbi:MAG: hypothetical protein ACE5GM_02790 [bacterium]
MKAAKAAFLLLLIVGFLLYYKYDLSQARHMWANKAGKVIH